MKVRNDEGLVLFNIKAAQVPGQPYPIRIQFSPQSFATDGITIDKDDALALVEDGIILSVPDAVELSDALQKAIRKAWHSPHATVISAKGI